LAGADYVDTIWRLARHVIAPSFCNAIIMKVKVLYLLNTLVLCGLGLLFVYEASVAEAFTMIGDQYYFLKQQSLRLALGLLFMVVASRVPMKVWQKTAVLWYFLGLALLVAVFIPGIGLELNGAKRWLSLGSFVLQPIEIMKLGIVLYFADWMSKHQKVGPFLVLTGIPAVLTILQPDLGSLLVLACIAMGLFFIAGADLKIVFGMVGLSIALLSIAIMVSPYRRERVVTYLNPESDPLGASFHIRQITIALGNGGLFGQGLGNSKQKYSYIPEASTDSIFAIIAEEVGFVGAFAIILLLSGQVFLASAITKKADSTFEWLLAIGCTIWLASQVILNLAAVVALVPLTGVPLPFFSYGGSSLLMLLLTSGILLRIGSEKYHKKQVAHAKHKKT
jgi:cell division protein FtsW